MSIDHTAVLLYGFQIPYPETDPDDSHHTHMDRVIHGLGLSRRILGDGEGVGYAEVGPWDRDRLYVCTAYHSAEVREVQAVTLSQDAEQYARWDGRLHAVARALGVKEHPTPEWRLLVDES